MSAARGTMEDARFKFDDRSSKLELSERNETT
jgi:hypothetical protein